MRWRFWKRGEDEVKIKSVRNIEDVKISVEEGLGGTRQIAVSAWNAQMAENLFWKIRNGLIGEKEEDG